MKSLTDPASMPKNFEHVIYEKKGHVAYVTIVTGRKSGTRCTPAPTWTCGRCWRDIGLDPQIYVGIVAGSWATRSAPDAT